MTIHDSQNREKVGGGGSRNRENKCQRLGDIEEQTCGTWLWEKRIVFKNKKAQHNLLNKNMEFSQALFSVVSRKRLCGKWEDFVLSLMLQV